MDKSWKFKFRKNHASLLAIRHSARAYLCPKANTNDL